MRAAARSSARRRACWPPSRTPTSRRWRRSAPGSTPSSRTRDRPGLKAWYRQLCKRPCFHDEYLQAFNEPGAHLIDTDGKGVERITEKGVVVAGREYEVDCIIYASGFEVGTEYKRRAGFDLTGRGG
jgi:cation diffusion facilitator CzcD-associated flavoprotein CzcO